MHNGAVVILSGSEGTGILCELGIPATPDVVPVDPDVGVTIWPRLFVGHPDGVSDLMHRCAYVFAPLSEVDVLPVPTPHLRALLSQVS